MLTTLSPISICSLILTHTLSGGKQQTSLDSRPTSIPCSSESRPLSLAASSWCFCVVQTRSAQTLLVTELLGPPQFWGQWTCLSIPPPSTSRQLMCFCCSLCHGCQFFQPCALWCPGARKVRRSVGTQAAWCARASRPALVIVVIYPGSHWVMGARRLSSACACWPHPWDVGWLHPQCWVLGQLSWEEAGGRGEKYGL